MNIHQQADLLNGSGNQPTTFSFTSTERTAVRHALCEHPKWAAYRTLYDVHIENLSDQSLFEVCNDLGLELGDIRWPQTPTRVDAPASDGERLVGIIKEGRQIFSVDLCKQILLQCNYKRQRDIDDDHVDVLAAAMRAQLWLGGSQIAFALYAGRLHLVNGQHRITTVIKTGLPQEFQVIIHTCHSEEELKAIYWRFDTVTRSRSMAQIIAAADIAREQNVSKGIADATLKAAGFILAGFRGPNINSKAKAERRIPDFRFEACQPLWPHARLYEKLIKNADGPLKRKLLTGSITAVALTTLQHQTARASQFWQAVADDNGLRTGQPEKALVNHLRNNADKGNGNIFLGAAACCWNAFFEKRGLQIVRPSMPIKLKGTPIEGKAQCDE